MTEENKLIIDGEARIIDEKHNGILNTAEVDNNTIEVIAEEVVEKKKPSYFITSESKKKVNINIICSPISGAILSIIPETFNIDYSKFPNLDVYKIWFEFTIPTYEQISNYRLNSGFYNPAAQRIVVDSNKMRLFFLKNHLKNWNLTDENGEEIKLNFDAIGCLNDESLDVVCNVFPTLIDIVLTYYEKNYLLIG